MTPHLVLLLLSVASSSPIVMNRDQQSPTIHAFWQYMPNESAPLMGGLIWRMSTKNVPVSWMASYKFACSSNSDAFTAPVIVTSSMYAYPKIRVSGSKESYVRPCSGDGEELIINRAFHRSANDVPGEGDYEDITQIVAAFGASPNTDDLPDTFSGIEKFDAKIPSPDPAAAVFIDYGYNHASRAYPLQLSISAWYGASETTEHTYYLACSANGHVSTGRRAMKTFYKNPLISFVGSFCGKSNIVMYDSSGQDISDRLYLPHGTANEIAISNEVPKIDMWVFWQFMGDNYYRNSSIDTSTNSPMLVGLEWLEVNNQQWDRSYRFSCRVRNIKQEDRFIGWTGSFYVSVNNYNYGNPVIRVTGSPTNKNIAPCPIGKLHIESGVGILTTASGFKRVDESLIGSPSTPNAFGDNSAIIDTTKGTNTGEKYVIR
jgi:hypothetical protein